MTNQVTCNSNCVCDNCELMRCKETERETFRIAYDEMEDFHNATKADVENEVNGLEDLDVAKENAKIREFLRDPPCCCEAKESDYPNGNGIDYKKRYRQVWFTSRRARRVVWRLQKRVKILTRERNIYKVTLQRAARINFIQNRLLALHSINIRKKNIHLKKLWRL